MTDRHAEQNEPKGKRSIRETVAGNVCGYIGGKFWVNLGDRFSKQTARDAAEWLAREVRK